MKLILTALAIALFTSASLPQTQALRDLNVHYMLRGYFFAGSSVTDKDALGGFGQSDNLPKTIDSGMNISNGEVSVIAFPGDIVPFSTKYRGIRVILVNTTNDKVGFSASDSRLYMIQEAIDTDGKWKPIEYLPSSWCGNSYHTVYLPSNEYWEFAAARYVGKLTTKLRIKLFIQGTDQKSRVLVSNEFEGSVNPKQFKVQQGHEPASIMDPYNN